MPLCANRRASELTLIKRLMGRQPTTAQGLQGPNPTTLPYGGNLLLPRGCRDLTPTLMAATYSPGAAGPLESHSAAMTARTLHRQQGTTSTQGVRLRGHVLRGGCGGAGGWGCQYIRMGDGTRQKVVSQEMGIL